MSVPTSTSIDIENWLRTIELGQYEDLFRKNEIDGEVLADVTELDLEKMGVPFGHRKRLIKAIRALLSSPSQKSKPEGRSSVEAAERRQLTVMFCDLVGSTAMSAQLDPEDMRAIMAAYQKCCADLIEINGGFVAKYMGDGVLAYFGYPLAHEHDAELSVRAGLAIADAVHKLEAVGPPLHVRVGIATGIVVVGDLLGSGESQERGVVGDTPNLAARLQSIAAPDTVVIAEGTRRLLGHLFELSDLGPQDLKGVAGPTPAWKVLPRSFLENRFEALHQGDLTELVGRGRELELMLESWAKARDGRGQVVLLSGEAGIGKSRMTASFIDRLAGEPHITKRFFCSPQRSDSALSPFIGHMERAAGFRRDDDVKAKLDKLDIRLAVTATSPQDAALIAAFLSLPNDGRYPDIDMLPARQRQSTMDALIWQVEAASRQSPVLMVFEDVHWADASSMELLDQLIARASSLRVMLLLTFRLEFVPPWHSGDYIKAIVLHRFDSSEVEALIDHVARGNSLAANVRQDIIERADGIPLFVEEMTKAVLEASDEAAVTHTIAAIPSPVLAVPASLHASLMSRLDRLGSAKAVAQISAAIGREVPLQLLATVTRLPRAELEDALGRLVEAGLMTVHGTAPDLTYTFKHALLQDTAYGTLLREGRRELHARIGEVLESQFPEVATNQPEILACHFAEAGESLRAAILWDLAGQLSVSRSAYVEAEAHFKYALSALAGLPDGPSRRGEQLKAQVGLANALMFTKSYTSVETKAAFEGARALVREIETAGEQLEDPFVTFSVLFGFWMTNYVAFNAHAVRELGAQSLALAEQHNDEIPLVIGHSLLGAALVVSGDLLDGFSHLESAARIYDVSKHSAALTNHFGMDFGTGFLAFRANAHWMCGRPDAARIDVEHALANARRIAHVPTLMAVLHRTGSLQLRLGNAPAAKAQADELIALAQEKKAPAFNAHAMADQACVLAAEGRAADAIHMLDRALAADKALASTVEIPTLLIAKALANAELGEFEAARFCLKEAATLIETTGERWWESDLHRAAGDIEWMSPERNPSIAAGHFARALQVARTQQAMSFELRAATGMARLWRDQGLLAEANAVLAPIHARFDPAFDMPDLAAAKALLREVL
ncbi:adenylate/guanylate cyclase domain-containing protein [Rhizobium calliandrae]|uniref:Adenylate/guanylate cyclase domain-containing protein n=1 Tax=Rhizobium calliandrae TaxID=1312182 RepID=A0ABT7KHU5_9HYPH|nr:adenylate/guanylate cyclase domain-containing protein [Rhizobium calliandrae]MDL2408209.1 adenylate/guanylate cyclase domain-containing protein [Rhizobium calliandrae]